MFSLTTGALLTVMILALMAPSVITVILTGSLGGSYEAIDTLNWAWTIGEAVDRQLYPTSYALLILGTGAIIGILNLFLLFRELDYRRIAVPERVQQDLQSNGEPKLS